MDFAYPAKLHESWQYPYSRKNKLYFAFRELGRVVRTIFLLRFLSDIDLRRTINAATNKSEAFNKFIQWVRFGGDGVISENLSDEQRKLIKYNHLVANLLAFHTVVTISAALDRMREEGYDIDVEALAVFSPYQTEHINRFGNYTLNPNRRPEPLGTAPTKRSIGRRRYGLLSDQCVFYSNPCQYPRNLEEMMEERGVQIDHSNLYRWGQKFTPLLEAVMLQMESEFSLLSFSW
jgi:hypothetical protein